MKCLENAKRTGNSIYFDDELWIISGPLSVDRFTEVEDDADVEVDVEQCSDSEAQLRASRSTQPTLPPSPSDDDRLSPEPVQVSYLLCLLIVIAYENQFWGEQ